jgi:hypothetical protein
MGNTIVIGDVQTTTAGDTITNQIAAALAAEGLGSNAGKLKRVDTGAWELAQNGVEYESPDQSASGIFSARIKRKYIAAGTSSGTVIAAGTTALVNCNAVVDGGFYHRAAGSARLPRSFPDHVDICRKESSGDIELILGGTGQSVLNGSWVDYV